MISLNPHGKLLGLLLSPFTDEETEPLNPGHSGSKACAVYLMPLSLSLLPLKCLTCHCSYSFLPMSSLKQHLLIHSTSICWVHIKCPGKGLGIDTVGRLIPPLPCQLGSIRGVLPDTQSKLTGPGGPQGPETP